MCHSSPHMLIWEAERGGGKVFWPWLLFSKVFTTIFSLDLLPIRFLPQQKVETDCTPLFICFIEEDQEVNCMYTAADLLVSDA